MLADFSTGFTRFVCKDKYNLLNGKSPGMSIPGLHITIIQKKIGSGLKGQPLFFRSLLVSNQHNQS